MTISPIEHRPPTLHPGSRLTILQHTRFPQESITLELPSAGRKLLSRVIICFLIVALMSSIPVVGLWYFLIYKNMMPGPASEAPVVSVHTIENAAPDWYPWMILISLAFISAIFLFAAAMFVFDALHILYGKTRITIAPDTLIIQKRLWDHNLPANAKTIYTDEITDLEILPPKRKRCKTKTPGCIRLTVIKQPIDLAEELDCHDQHDLATLISQHLNPPN